MRNLLAGVSAITSTETEKIIAPIIEVLEATVPALLGLVAAIGAIWCIVLGVKYAKAEDPQAHEQAKKALINAIIGFVLVFLLLVMLDVAVDIFKPYYQNKTGTGA